MVKVTQEKVKEPKELQQETVNKDEEEDNLKHEVKETASEKKPLFPKKEKNKSSSLFNNLRRKSSVFANPVKKSLFGNKRKPGKSGLCKIINCSRNKSHFCCKPDEVSEVKENVEAEVVTEEPKKKVQIDADEDKPQDNFDVDKNHVENASKGPSASKQTALERVTDDKGEDQDEVRRVGHPPSGLLPAHPGLRDRLRAACERQRPRHCKLCLSQKEAKIERQRREAERDFERELGREIDRTRQRDRQREIVINIPGITYLPS